MRRLVEETACVHGYFGGCTFKTDSGEPCPGGTSRVVEVDELIGEVGLRLLRRANRGETITPERATTEMLNVFDAALGVGS